MTLGGVGVLGGVSGAAEDLERACGEVGVSSLQLWRLIQP